MNERIFPNVADANAGLELTGTVAAHIPDLEMFVVAVNEEVDFRICVSKVSTDPKVYNVLAIGSRVKFRMTAGLAPRIRSISVFP